MNTYCIPRPGRRSPALYLLLLNALLAVTKAEEAPRILSHPSGRVVAVGNSITLEVSAAGTQPLSYRWLKDGAPLAADGSPKFVFTPTSLESGGLFSVVVTNHFGSVTSTLARVTVIPALPGTLDASVTLPPNPSDIVRTIKALPNGKLLVTGHFQMVGNINAFRIARLNADLSVDADFQAAPGADGPIFCMTIQPDGKILIGGDFSSYNNVPRSRLARLNPDGSLDPSFRSNDPSPIDQSVWAISVLPDQKVMIGGDFTMVDGRPIGRLARLTSSGGLDPTFVTTGGGFDGSVRSIAIEQQNRMYVAGSFSNYRGQLANSLVALNGQGNRITDFEGSATPVGSINVIVLQPDGLLLVGGRFDSYGNRAAPRIARIRRDGSLDSTFNPGAGADMEITSIALQSDGRVVVTGGFTRFDQQPGIMWLGCGRMGVWTRCLTRAWWWTRGWKQRLSIPLAGS